MANKDVNPEKTTKINTKPTQADLDKSDLSQRRSTIILVTILIAVIALISSVYAIYLTKKSDQPSKKETLVFNDGLEQFKQQQSKILNQFATNQQTLQQAQENIQNKMQTLNHNLQLAMEQRLYQKQDWLLLKARYYLELAQINNQWSNDQQTTLALLKQADELLAPIANSQLFPIRQAIAEEIVKIKAQPLVDITGLLSQLDAAQSLAENLHLKPRFNSNSLSANAENKSSDNQATNWQQGLQQSKQLLEKLVVIRHRDAANNLPITPLQEAIMHESIHLHLQEAQWALLKGNPQLFANSLRQTIKDLKRSFDMHNENTQVLLTQLQNLQQEKIVATKQDIDQSLLLLNQLIEMNAKKSGTV